MTASAEALCVSPRVRPRGRVHACTHVLASRRVPSFPAGAREGKRDIPRSPRRPIEGAQPCHLDRNPSAFCLSMCTAFRALPYTSSLIIYPQEHRELVLFLSLSACLSPFFFLSVSTRVAKRVRRLTARTMWRQKNGFHLSSEDASQFIAIVNDPFA